MTEIFLTREISDSGDEWIYLFDEFEYLVPSVRGDEHLLVVGIRWERVGTFLRRHT